MLFDDLPDDVRKSTIRWIEESLFGAATYGASYFHDVPPTMTGFVESTHQRTFKVNVPADFFSR